MGGSPKLLVPFIGDDDAAVGPPVPKLDAGDVAGSPPSLDVANEETVILVEGNGAPLPDAV